MNNDDIAIMFKVGRKGYVTDVLLEGKCQALSPALSEPSDGKDKNDASWVGFACSGFARSRFLDKHSLCWLFSGQLSWKIKLFPVRSFHVSVVQL